jgi:hypothetical protein
MGVGPMFPDNRYLTRCSVRSHLISNPVSFLLPNFISPFPWDPNQRSPLKNLRSPFMFKFSKICKHILKYFTMLDLERRTFSTLTQSEWVTACQELSLYYEGSIVFAKTATLLEGITIPDSFFEQLSIGKGVYVPGEVIRICLSHTGLNK